MKKYQDFLKLNKAHGSSGITVKDFTSDKSKLLKTFSAYQRNLKYLTENREKLRAKYGNRYVAVCKSGIRIDRKNLPSLLREVKKKYGTSQEVVVDYVGRKKVSLLL